MNMKLINFCYIINDYVCENKNTNTLNKEYIHCVGRINYVEFLCMSIETLLKFYEPNIEHIYILCDYNNLTVDQQNYLINKINKININNKIVIKKINLSILDCIQYPTNNDNKWKIGKIGLLKFLIPSLIDCDEVIYTDADILYNQNILDDILLDIDLNKHIFKFFSTNHDPNSINSGFIYFNCKLYNNYGILNEVIKWYDEIPNIKYVDNSCFLYLAQKYSNNTIICLNNKNVKYYINYYLDDLNKLSNQYSVIHFYGVAEHRFRDFVNTYNAIINK